MPVKAQRQAESRITAPSFTVAIPQATIDDLHDRLARTRWTSHVEGSGWNYGTDLDYLKELTDYWQHQYDWRKQETALNQFHHFKAEINGIGIHFIHEHGKAANSFPLILTHGYPDSFYRFAKLIPMLTDPESPLFGVALALRLNVPTAVKTSLRVAEPKS
jgi:hypothetical protein